MPRPEELAPGPLPRHIAIIMDGNGRWAELRGCSRLEGHAEGALSVKDIVTAAREAGIEALTLYAFSVQNWGRPDEEVDHLMGLLLDYLATERSTILDNDIKLQSIGQTHRLPLDVQASLRKLQADSKDNSGMVLTLALSYGGREEIVAACQQIAERVKAGELEPEAIDEALIDQYLFTRDLPPVDLLIRTSGEMRLSNFLLWQVAYAELVITEVLWPDFRRPNLHECIEVYRKRERRYGLTGAQVSDGEG